jgi:CheY-like chemotaxis protein/DNA-directed RNA polymerase specialized sigma24 family protein
MDEQVMSGPDRTALVRALPYARRYARALLGSQEKGDAVVAQALRAALAGADPGPGEAGARAALYLAISDQVRRAPPDAFASSAAESDLSLPQRMLLLLTALEEQPLSAAAAACRLTVEIAERELRSAREGIRSSAAARVLIIEDEPIIALDIQDLVERCGHSVVGIAATEAEAVQIARAERPSLVLADINLGAGGDGATAVSRILRDVTAPVIFVTAFPERLLTGDAVEPAFVITKPFDPTTLAVATYQAVTRGVRPV